MLEHINVTWLRVSKCGYTARHFMIKAKAVLIGHREKHVCSLESDWGVLAPALHFEVWLVSVLVLALFLYSIWSAGFGGVVIGNMKL